MKKKFSTKWKSSKRPGKQRKYQKQAPLHIKQKFLSTHLSKDLRNKHGTRNITLAKGDKVKVIRGQFKGRENKVERIDHKNLRVYITGIERAKKDGSKSLIPLKTVSLMITELNLEDKKRKAVLERQGKAPVKPAKKEKAEKKAAPASKPASKPAEKPAAEAKEDK